MNPKIDQLRTYPFSRLAARLEGVAPPSHLNPINMHIGEPRHAPPDVVAKLLGQGNGLGRYPASIGSPELRQSCAGALTRRYDLTSDFIDSESMIVPVNGTREGLFAFVQAATGRKRNGLVVMPNPFYQIYEGAAILAGVEPYYLNTTEDNNFVPNLKSIPADIWHRCEVLFLCNPGNPSGTLMSADDWRLALELADRYDFLVAADECYADIYREGSRPVGLLEVCKEDGRSDLSRCAVFHSLSKRSNVPGLRSGFIAADPSIVEPLRQYRNYHGCAMAQTVQDASVAAWDDDLVPAENRHIYDQKYAAFMEILGEKWALTVPSGAFYLWPETPLDDRDFVRGLFASQGVKLLPGQYLARESEGYNPGRRRVRLSLVPDLADCREAAKRISTYLNTL
ncbi:MAG: succinyldiaminopimelate transaminase [Gammaproteobacteria bacterium]